MKKKKIQLMIKFQADLVKLQQKQSEEHQTLASFNESQLNNFAN